MAQELIGFKIQIDGQDRVVKSLGEMKQLLKEANFELLAAQQNFGEYSQEAVAAAKKVAGLKDSLQEAGETAQLFDPGKKFQAFAGALGAVAGGISAVQGAIGLVGDESEDLQKTLVKVQSALALSQGLSAITDSAKDFARLKVIVVDAFKAIRLAIGSTGIGAIVIAVGALVAYWDEIKAAVSGVSEEQSQLNEKTKANLEAEKAKLTELDNQENTLKLQGKSEKEILNLKIQQTDQVIAATEENIKQQQITLKAQVQASKRNKEILEGILKFLTVPITALLKAVDYVGKALGKDFGLEEKVFGGLAKLVFDPKGVEEEGQKTIKELDNQLKQVKKQRDGYQLSIQNIDKQAAEKATQEQQKQNEKELEARRILEEAKISLLTERRQKEIAINTEYDAKLQKLKEAGIKDDGTLEQARQKALNELDLTYKQQSEDREKEFVTKINEIRTKTRLDGIKDENQKALEELSLSYQKEREAIIENEQFTAFEKIALLAELKKQENLAIVNLQTEFDLQEQERTRLQNETIAQENRQFREAELAADIELANRKYDAANAGFELLSSLTGKNEKLANVIFAIQKAIEIGRIITSTAAAISQVKAGVASIPPFLPPGIPNKAFILAGINGVKQIAGLKITAAANIASIAAATITKFKSGSAGGAGTTGGDTGGISTTAPIAPTASVQAQSTALNAQAIQQMGSASYRAYVIESDVTNSQERIRRINRAARLG